MKKFTLNETIFTQLMTMNLEGIELIPAAKRIMPEVLQLAGHGPVTDEFLTGKILDLYEFRSMILLRSYIMRDGYDPMALTQFRATLFRNHLLTYARVDETKMDKWDLEEYITNLAWFEPYLILVAEDTPRFTHDDVLDMSFLRDFKENVTKAEVDKVVYFLNGGLR